MLDFARRQELEQNPVDINEIIRQIIFLWELNASMYNIRVLTELQDNLPSVSGDELKLRQVFINLGRNALQAIGENGTISIKTFANAYWVIVKITDSGVGIPPNKLHKIFDPYYTTKESGSGLGLSVVHQIVSAHGGHIEVDSKIGEGTTVTVKLPVKGGKDS
jgi:two-component system sensor histidine kinase AtoS